jgi:hypothetical protein
VCQQEHFDHTITRRIEVKFVASWGIRFATVAEPETAERFRAISTGIEALVGSLTAAIAQIQTLEGDIAERDLDIELLRAQLKAVRTEMLRKRYSTKRIVAIVGATAGVVGALSTAALAVEGARPPAAATVNFGSILKACDDLRTTVTAPPRTAHEKEGWVEQGGGSMWPPGNDQGLAATEQYTIPSTGIPADVVYPPLGSSVYRAPTTPKAVEGTATFELGAEISATGEVEPGPRKNIP